MDPEAQGGDRSRRDDRHQRGDRPSYRGDRDSRQGERGYREREARGGGGYRGDRDSRGGRDGAYRPREGGYRDREGGYRGPREGGYRDRDGGRREGGDRGGREAGPREGGYRGPREGGYRDRDGGRREGGYRDRDGGGREGGYRGDREGGFRGGPREGGYRDREGGYRGGREGGPRDGGYRGPRDRDGARREGGGYRDREGYRGDRGPREGGYRAGREGAPGERGYRDREGYRGDRGPRDGGFRAGREGAPRERGYRGREGGYRDRAGDERRERAERPAPERVAAPPLPEEIVAADLAGEVRAELLSLARPVADTVARHLVATGHLIDEDPEQALAHALAARRLASRISAVREAVGLAAYRAGEWQTAIAELRTYHRMSGRQTHLAVLADCERALGRPERAIDIYRGANREALDKATAIELLIVAAGARRDMGQPDAAVAMLQVRELTSDATEPWAARLRYAYADSLLAAGRREEAREWFARAADADESAETDAAERLLELDGVILEGDEEYEEGDAAEEPAAPAASDEGDLVVVDTDVDGGPAPAVLTGDDDATEPGGPGPQERPGPSAP